MVSEVQEYLLDKDYDESVLCFTDEHLVDPAANVEQCVVCYRYPLSPRYVSVHCRKHTVCLACGDRLKTCPLCRRRVQALYRNLETGRLNGKVELRCPFNEFGCQVSCRATRWAGHIRECSFEGIAWREYFRQYWASNEQRTLKSCFSFLKNGCRRLRLRTFGTASSGRVSTNPDFTRNSTEL